MASSASQFQDIPADCGLNAGSLQPASTQSDFREQRKSQRHITILRVALMRVSGHNELCLIRNISSGGLMAHVYSKLTVGQQVDIEFRDTTYVSGQIRWVRGESVGVAFEKEISLETVLAIAPLNKDGKRPRAPRIAVSANIRLLRQDGSASVAEIDDISQGGVKLKGGSELKSGEHVVVEIPALGPIAGTLRWQKDAFAGIAFARPVSYPKLSQWLKEYAI